MHIKITKKYLFFDKYKVKCAVGKRGIRKKKKEGDFITPIGTFKIKFIYYRRDKIKKLQTNLKKKPINKSMGWCDDPRSKQYNQLIKYPFKYSSEKLYRNDNIYDIILVLNFNMNPIKKSKGSAIFIHIAKKKFESTKGCVAVRKVDLLRIIKHLKKNSKIRIF